MAERCVRITVRSGAPGLPPRLHACGRTRLSAEQSEGSDDNYRKGVAADWRTYFTPRVTDEFKARYGDLLIHLGYASSRDW